MSLSGSALPNFDQIPPSSPPRWPKTLAGPWAARADVTSESVIPRMRALWVMDSRDAVTVAGCRS